MVILVEESFRCYGLYTAETIPTALGCQWGPAGHLLFGIEAFLEYHPLLDSWKKLSHYPVPYKVQSGPCWQSQVFGEGGVLDKQTWYVWIPGCPKPLPVFHPASGTSVCGKISLLLSIETSIRKYPRTETLNITPLPCTK